MCASRAQAEQVKARLAGWLEPRGLAFNEAKTKIVHLIEGFDFLGFNIRRYPNGKLLTKPSKEALRQIRRRLSAEMKALRGANADAVITRLNPVITGWAAYYRIGASKRVLPPSLFEHPAAELSVDDSAQLGEDRRQPDHIA